MNKLIDKIKEIDVMLDAYEYKNCTFDEYQEHIKHNERGNASLRNMIRNSSHIWSSIMERDFKELKDTVNMMYLVKNNRYKLNTNDVNKIRTLSSKIRNICETFKKKQMTAVYIQFKVKVYVIT